MDKKRFIGNVIYATSMLLIVVMRILTTTGILSGLSDTASDAVWSACVQCVFMGIVPFSLYLIYLKKSGAEKPVKTLFREFGYTRGISAKGWIIVLVLSLLSTFVITCVSNVWYNLISAVGYKPAISSPELPYTVGILFFELLTTAILPPLFEEFTNRGLLYNAHNEGNKPLRIIMLTALMFALMHTNVTQVLYTFIFGLIAGALVYTTKSIWPAVAYHFINNFVAVLKTYGRLNENGMYFLSKMYNWLLGTVVGGLVSAVLFIVIAIFISYLLFELSSIETERRIKKGIETCATDDDTAVVKRSRYDNLPLYFALALNAICTIFTLIWGIIR